MHAETDTLIQSSTVPEHPSPAQSSACHPSTVQRMPPEHSPAHGARAQSSARRPSTVQRTVPEHSPAQCPSTVQHSARAQSSTVPEHSPAQCPSTSARALSSARAQSSALCPSTVQHSARAQSSTVPEHQCPSTVQCCINVHTILLEKLTSVNNRKIVFKPLVYQGILTLDAIGQMQFETREDRLIKGKQLFTKQFQNKYPFTNIRKEKGKLIQLVH